MESIRSESAIPFKSKKKSAVATTATPKKQPPPSPSPVAVITPEKSNPPSNRIRNQNFPLSVADVQRKALQLRQSNPNELDRPRRGAEDSIRSGTAVQKSKDSERSTALLPERRFTLHHLAQLKHIMPELIVVEKIRVLDEETKCMKEDLILKLEVDAVENDRNLKGATGFSQLKGIFRSRITEYSTSHLEGEDIPEGELPHLFYLKKQDLEQSRIQMPTPSVASHIGPSFKSRFSSRSFSTSIPDLSPAEQSSRVLETPVKEPSSTKVEEGSPCLKSDIQRTPAAVALTPSKLMAATPALRPPKRSLMSPDHDVSDLHNDRSAKRSRSLKFDENHGDIEDQESKVEEDNVPAECSIASGDIFDILPENLVQSLKENERRIKQEQDPVVSQARRRQQLMAGVPKLFDMIRLLFQSIRRNVITKQELIHKIVAGNMDIVDRREVDEQLKLLLEVAPEYLSEQLCLSGDILLRLNKSSDAESVRAKLLDAK